jgi:predicted RND superfamily exporter protein
MVLKWLAEQRRRDPGSLDPDRIAADLRRFMDEEGFRVGAEFDQKVALVRRALSLDENFSLDKLDELVAPKHISRFVHQESGHTEMVTYVYPNQASHAGQYRVMELLEANVVGEMENAHVIGVAILGRELKRLIKEGSLEAAALALLLVLVLLWTHFRQLRYVVLTAVPLILGEVGAIGGMTLLGMNLNLVNMGIIPVILGIGIDDGIHITHRFLDQGERNVVGVFRFAGRAVVITSLTTMVGFGSLAFATYKGLWTAGVFAILGVGMCLLSSVTLLPALLEICVVRQRERRTGTLTAVATGDAAASAAGQDEEASSPAAERR